ncbi:homoserine dehydrogenase, partial [Desulfovibrio sp. OttesenSCG-928-G11]|nr:homoserine dehydrogenase [Desulfovibrio sp. OttesenSCG-928-G11]
HPFIIGLAGFGTVGTGLARILSENRTEIMARTGREIQVKSVLVRDAAKKRAADLPRGARLTTDMDDLLSDPDIEAVVELMGGTDAAGRLIEAALMAGKHVVTANKALLAEQGGRLFSLAADKGLHIGYEASICGGIPVVQTLRESLAGNRLQSLVGILNGTSNYILSEMSTRGLSFDAALQKARELGYAEADPTLDIDGHDAAHKLALLIRLAWGTDYPFESLSVQGISGVKAEDIVYAREFGYRIKLLAHARLIDDAPSRGGGSPLRGGIEAGVCPTLVHETFLLARVGGVYNAVRVQGNAVGSLFLHGRGAGDMPTGSAVAADLLTLARGAKANNTGFARPHLPVPARIIPEEQAFSHFYIRLQVTDRPGVLRDVAAAMAENGISIAQVIQKNQAPKKDSREREPAVPLIAMTHAAPTAGVRRALQSLENSTILHEKPVLYRVMPNIVEAG